MASAFSHAAVALSIGTCFYRPQVSKRVWVAGVACSVIPDLDVIGFRLGIPYGDFWGHRGFTHSLFFAALLAGMVMLVVAARDPAAVVVRISISCDREPRRSRRHDQRRAWHSVLLTF